MSNLENALIFIFRLIVLWQLISLLIFAIWGNAIIQNLKENREIEDIKEIGNWLKAYVVAQVQLPGILISLIGNILYEMFRNRGYDFRDF